MTKHITGRKPSKRDVIRAKDDEERAKLVKERAEFEVVQDELRKQANERTKQFQDDVAKIAATEEGKRFFRVLMSDCGFREPGVMLNGDGSAQSDVMLVRNSKRDVWLGIAQYIPTKDLIRIEHSTVAEIQEIPPQN